jgi:large subunit ribosomal protein L19
MGGGVTGMNEKVRAIEQRYVRDEAPDFRIGDTVRVHVRIREGEKERTQAFEGTVLSRQGSGSNETFTVRRVASGIGVERVFPLSSPNVQKIIVTRRGKARRAKLFYLRERRGKAAKTKAKDLQ